MLSLAKLIISYIVTIYIIPYIVFEFVIRDDKTGIRELYVNNLAFVNDKFCTYRN